MKTTSWQSHKRQFMHPCFHLKLSVQVETTTFDIAGLKNRSESGLVKILHQPSWTQWFDYERTSTETAGPSSNMTYISVPTLLGPYKLKRGNLTQKQCIMSSPS